MTHGLLAMCHGIPRNRMWQFIESVSLRQQLAVCHRISYLQRVVAQGSAMGHDMSCPIALHSICKRRKIATAPLPHQLQPVRVCASAGIQWSSVERSLVTAALSCRLRAVTITETPQCNYPYPPSLTATQGMNACHRTGEVILSQRVFCRG